MALALNYARSARETCNLRGLDDKYCLNLENDIDRLVSKVATSKQALILRLPTTLNA